MSHHPMGSADAAWLHMDSPTNLMVVNSVLWFEQPLDIDALKAVYRERLIARFPRFSQRVTERDPVRGPAWEDDPYFDLDAHFLRIALPAPHDQGALQELVGDLITQPLDRKQALWQVYVIEGYGEGCALLSRIHHCIADGIALARMMLSLTDGADGEPPGFLPERNGHRSLLGPVEPLLRPVAKVAGAVLHEGIETLGHPRHVGELAAMAAMDAQTLVKQLLPGSDPPSVLKRSLGIANRVAWSDPVPLQDVKVIGRSMGATVNDVLMAAVTGSIRDYLETRGDKVDRELHTMVPFNLRPLDKPLPRELGNQFGLILLGLPTEVADPRERVAAVKERMDSIKRSHEGVFSYGILNLLGRTPVAVESQLISFFTAKASMVMTNVPGPRERVLLAGTPVAGVQVWAPCSGSIGMTVSIFSYAGDVTVGFMTDAHLVSDPGALAEGFRTQLSALGRLAKPAAPAGRAR